MSSIKKHNGKSWDKFGSTKAIDIKLTDYSGLYESDNVEGALREASSKIEDIKSAVEGQKSAIQKHSDDIAWLKENGGGGGGGGSSMAPTITSTFVDGSIVEKDKDVIIPIFYSSPNLGDGLAYIVIDGIEVNTVSVKQGNNKINIGKLYNLHNEVSIYVKDRIGMLSNQLTWNVVCGGIDVTINFDDTADYEITDTISMQFNVETASSEPIYMQMTVDYDTFTVECNKGHNEYIFAGLGVGIHRVSFYLESGPYKTSTFNYTIVVVSGNQLYVSSTFTGGIFELGEPISINYRISKASTEEFKIELSLNDVVEKTLQAPVGSYFWTINNKDVGEYTYKIRVYNDYGEDMSITGTFSIVAGEYTPLSVSTAGLLYRLNAAGRTNADSDRSNPRDNSGNGVRTRLHNFNYFSNGWIDDMLVCDGNAYVEIDLFPWSDNAIYGSTIEVHFRANDIGMVGTRIFDYTDVETPYKGAYIDLEETTMKSLANTGKINIDSDKWITLSFVIDRKNKFGKIYVNGICSRAFSLSDTGSGTSAVREDFTHNQKIYINSLKGLEKFGACDIKDIRVYGRTLDEQEILNNHIAQIIDIDKQKFEYDFNYNNRTLPVIRMYGDTSKMTLETPVTMRIKYTSPNDEKYGQSFDLPYCQVNWQGTSSLQYVLKNFTARLKDENMADYEYTPYPNGVPETVYCFKCDYMESTHSRNTGLAKFVNECLYDEKNPAQLKNPNVRNAVNGFPMLLYINDELQGVYNFNLDRYSTNSFGYNDDTTLVYEVSANSDTTAGAFYKWTEASGKSKLDYYKSDFECLYPPTRAAGNDNMEELIRLVEWVNDSSDEDFRDNIGRYFNLQYLLRYFLYVYVVGAVDSLGKNMKLATWDGLIWYPQVYDADTTIGLDNTGFLKFDMDIEMGDEHVFNTTGSKLWQKVRLLFDAELKEQYALMRQKHFTVENITKYVIEEQIQSIPARYYNIDMQTKYLNYGSSYLYALHGSGELHITKWLRERLIYCDTLFGYNVSTSDYITLRSSKLGYVYLDIQTYIPMYVRVKWRDEANNTGVQVKRVGRGETVRFEYNMPTATDQEIIVYAGYYLKSLGDVSNLQPTSMLIANASRLTEIECHSSNLINTDLSACTKLQRIDLSGSKILGTGIGAQPILNIQNCKYLRYCDCDDTQLTAIYTMQQGGNLEELYFPKTVQVVQTTNQTYLRVLSIPDDSVNLANVQITNCKAIESLNRRSSELNFSTLKYVQNMTIINSLDKLKSMSFSGFTKMRNVQLSSMTKLEELGFDNMMPVEEISTFKNLTISDCPLVDTISFNVTSDDYKIAFADGAKIDFSGLPSVKNVVCNYSVKGLDTLIVPITIKNVKFSSEYGDGVNEIKNIWSSSANHSDDGFQGIDFLDLSLEDFDMTGCKYLTKAINFHLSPVNKAPNISEFELLEGSLTYDRYVGPVTYMFKGVNFNFENFEVRFNKMMPQTDITGLLQNAIIDDTRVKELLKYFPNATVYDYFLNNTTITKDIEFPPNTTSVIGAFKDCKFMTHITSNWDNEYNSSITPTDCYRGCTSITHLDGESLVVNNNNSGLDSVPSSWGGYGFTSDYTGIYEIEVEAGTTITIDKSTSTPNFFDNEAISWGDGDITEGVYSHTYKNAGKYIVKGKFIPILDCQKTFQVYLTRILQVPSVRFKAIGIFQGSSKLTYADISNGNLISYQNIFSNCTSLEEVICGNTENVETFLNAFNNCPSLVSIRNLRIGAVCKNTVSMLQGTKSLTELEGMDTWDMQNVQNISSTFSGSGILDYSGITNWNLSSCTNATNCFYNTVAEEIDVSGWVSNIPNVTSVNNGMFMNSKAKRINVANLVKNRVTTLSAMFESTPNLEEVIGMETWDTSSVNIFERIFYNGGVKLSSVNMSNWTFEGPNQYNNLALSGLPNNCTIIMNNITGNPEVINTILKTFNNNRTFNLVMEEFNENMTNFAGMLAGTRVKNDINLPIWATDVTGMCTNCTQMTHIHSNWNKIYEIEPITTSWTLNQKLSVSGSNFGQLVNQYNDVVSGFIEFNSNINLTLHSVQLWVNVVGYDENQNAIGYYNGVQKRWVIDKNGTNYRIDTKEDIIKYDSRISYIRISLYNPDNTGKNVLIPSIPSKDCYSGCTSIVNVDGEDLLLNEYISCLDDIPLTWGGYGFSRATTAILVIETPNDNYEFASSAYPNDSFMFTMTEGTTVNWGDGTIENVAETTGCTPRHTYAKAGRYVIKGNLLITRPGYGGHTPATNCVVEVIQYPTANTLNTNNPGHFAFYRFNKCTYINARGLTLTGASFRDCTKLVEVDLTNAIFDDPYEMFWNNQMLTTLTGIETVEVRNLKNSGSMFNHCYNLRDFSFLRNWDWSKCTNINSMFSNNRQITELDLSWMNAPIENCSGLVSGCPNLVNLNIEGMINPNTIPVKKIDTGNMIYNCPKLEDDPHPYLLNCGAITAVSYRETPILTEKNPIIDIRKYDTSQLSYIAPGKYHTHVYVGEVDHPFSVDWRWTEHCGYLRDWNFMMGDYSFMYYGGGHRATSWDFRFTPNPDNIYYKTDKWPKQDYNNFNNNMKIGDTKWTIESLVSLFECLHDYAAEGKTADVTIKLGNNLARLSDSQIAILTKKGWNVSA